MMVSFDVRPIAPWAGFQVTLEGIATSAVLNRQDCPVAGDFGEALFEVAKGDVDAALERTELGTLLRLADVEVEEIRVLLHELFELFGVGDFTDGRVLSNGG